MGLALPEPAKENPGRFEVIDHNQIPRDCIGSLCLIDPMPEHLVVLFELKVDEESKCKVCDDHSDQGSEMNRCHKFVVQSQRESKHEKISESLNSSVTN